MKTNIELVMESDSFPYYDDDPDEYSKRLSSYYKFRLWGENETRGYMLEWVVNRMIWPLGWDIDHEHKIVLTGLPRFEDQKDLIAKTMDVARKNELFKLLKGWRDEAYPINRAPNTQIGIERAGSPLFGIVTYGVHLTAYVKVNGALKIWVPRRANNKQTYGGMLDNTVAGGIAIGENPMTTLVREAAEEASLPEDLVRANAKAAGTVSYFHVRDERAGGEVGLLQPEVEYVFDMEIRPDVVPKPADNEVEEFYLWSVEEVQKAMSEGQFKPNCAVVLLDFLVRHGVLNSGNEPDLIEIVSRIHRKLPFPTRDL